MKCWVESSYSSHLPAKFVNFVHCEREDKVFLICHVTMQLRCQVSLWVVLPYLKLLPYYVWVHRPCESGHITFLMCHMATWLMCHVTL